jgi:ubiquinone/menaquinone biosynthesis C-methylase UbiE
MAAMSEAEYRPTYSMDNRWRAELDRLQLLENHMDPVTQQRFDKVGLGPGWRCLEVGAGAGSVVRMLAERVGADGRVLAVDLQPALLGDLDEPNVEVRQLDVVTGELPEAAFDFVHTRAVLMHIGQRDEVLPKLVRALRPGGLLLLEEVDMSPAFEGDNIFSETVRAVHPYIEAAGGSLRWARAMPDWVAAAGLEDIGSSVEYVSFGGGSTLAQFFRLSWLELLEKLDFTEPERALIQACRAALDSPHGDYPGWDLVTVWGRRL